MREVAAVGAIVVRDGAVLLVRRGRPPAAGLWSVPGGKVEPGEAETDAVLRELAEETGLIGKVIGLAGEVVRPGVGDVVYHIRDYLVEPVGGAEQAGDDASALAWAPFDQLSAYDLTDGLLDTLREWHVTP
jgi:ADP-ribose pyrophosphatase YjhB (NUDIX family)